MTFHNLHTLSYTLWKLGKYMESGIYPNKDLLITIEEPGGGIDIENLNQMLDWFLA